MTISGNRGAKEDRVVAAAVIIVVPAKADDTKWGAGRERGTRSGGAGGYVFNVGPNGAGSRERGGSAYKLGHD